MYLIILLVALIASAIGFKKYVWFISIGYGAAIAGIGVALLVIFRNEISIATLLLCLLFVVYGFRLSGYLAFREIKSTSYNKKMKTEIKDGSKVGLIAKCGIWITAAILYACETSPVLFRLMEQKENDLFVWVGLVIMIIGLLIESLADLQKNKAKKQNPNRFVDTGLFKLVRCPNYLGEMLFWTGVFVSGVSVCHTWWQWLSVLGGYLGIIYVMFGGARRLEIRQNKSYGNDPEYQKYVSTTPIMVPFIPLYSVEKYKWLVA